MNLKESWTDGGAKAVRTISSILFIVATVLLVGSLITAHSANTSPNSGRVTTAQQI